MRTWLSCVVALAAGAAGQQAAAPRLTIPHEHYVLANGMHVILAPDPSLPRVVVNTWYRVGSKDDPPGRSGFAHLFEHLMFMGTERVPNIDDVMEAAGGANNASTNSDRTNYYDWGPPALLETLLWLEADRLENLGRCMTQEKLDRQRDIVRNERRQTSENTPYGKADLLVSELMYPPGHPYHIDTIGRHEDLEAATVADVKAFFATYYVPDNASLCIAGDFDPVVARQLVQRYFGDLPPGPEPAVTRGDPVILDGPRAITLRDDVELRRLTFVWHSPAAFAPGDAAMDLLADVLAGGRSSRLHQRLVVKDRSAVDVSANQSSGVLGSTFRIDVMLAADADLAAVRAAVDEELEALRRDGPQPGELKRASATIETAFVDGLQSPDERADDLNRYLFHFGDPDGFQRDLDRYLTATPQDVRAWARTVLGAPGRLEMTVLPQDAPEEPDARVAGPSGTAAAAAPFVPPVPVMGRHASGLEVWHLDRPALPLVELALVLPVGRDHEPAEKAGLAALTAALLQEGAGDRDGAAFAAALEELGARLDVRVGERQTVLHLSVLRRNLDPAVDLLLEALRHPRFAPEDVERVRALTIEQLRQDLEDPALLARQVTWAAWWGDDHPYGRPVGGRPETVAALTLEDVRSFHKLMSRPAGGLLVMAGDLRVDEAVRVADDIDHDWPSTGTPNPNAVRLPGPKSASEPRVLLVDRPGAPQTVVRWVLPADEAAGDRRLTSDVLNVLFGGSFTSRLNRNLREEHGYTYGAGSRFVRWPECVVLQANSAVRTDVTGASLKEFLAEFARLKAGDITEAESQSAQATALADLVESTGDLSGLVSTWLTRRERAETPADLVSDASRLGTLRSEDVDKLGTMLAQPEHALLVLVGDAQAVLPQLQGLELPAPVLVDERARPVEASR
jgi:predicted Zn-dependent peptidase